MTESEIIKGCKKQDRQCQRLLYDLYAERLFGVCLRYLRDRQEAEDVYSEGMYKVLTKIKQYSGSGSLYGWMKRIMVNESLMRLRKKKLQLQDIDDVSHLLEDDSYIEENLFAADIKAMMDELPTGYRTIINLYLIEGYKHREIAEMLGISINTSKSQLILAKKRMIQFLERMGHPRTESEKK